MADVSKKRDDEVGALWQKLNRDGDAFYTGTINGQDVIVFENKFKKSDQHPHFRVYKSQRKAVVDESPF